MPSRRPPVPANRPAGIGAYRLAVKPSARMLQGYCCLGDHRHTHAHANHGFSLVVIVGQEPDIRLRAGVVGGSLKYLNHRVRLRTDYPRLLSEVIHGHFITIRQGVPLGHEDHRALLEDLRDANGFVVKAVPRLVPEQAQSSHSGLQVRNQFIEAGAAHRAPALAWALLVPTGIM